MAEFNKYFNESGHQGHFSHSGPMGTKSVFVGDLSFFCTEIELAMAFSPYGEISALEIKRGRYGDSLMHGFVEYTTDSAAQRAIAEMNGKKFMGRKMRVNRTNVKVGPNPGYSEWVQIHVNFQCQNLTTKVTEEFLDRVFCSFGSIGDITVKRHLCNREPAQVTGYAFVYFLDAYAALRATHAIKGVTIEGVTMECCLTYRSEQALMNQAGVASAMRLQMSNNNASNVGAQKYSQHNQMNKRVSPPRFHQQSTPSMYPQSSSNGLFARAEPASQLFPASHHQQFSQSSASSRQQVSNHHSSLYNNSNNREFSDNNNHLWSNRSSMKPVLGQDFFATASTSPLEYNNNGFSGFSSAKTSGVSSPSAAPGFGLSPVAATLSSSSDSSLTQPRSSTQSIDSRCEDEDLLSILHDLRSQSRVVGDLPQNNNNKPMFLSAARESLLQDDSNFNYIMPMHNNNNNLMGNGDVFALSHHQHLQQQQLVSNNAMFPKMHSNAFTVGAPERFLF